MGKGTGISGEQEVGEEIFGQEKFEEIRDKWDSKLCSLHEGVIKGEISRKAYIQGILDGVADYGAELEKAATGGQIHMIFLWHWIRNAKELMKRWNKLKREARKVVKEHHFKLSLIPKKWRCGNGDINR